MALELISIFCMINDDKDEDSPGRNCLKDRRTLRIALRQHHQSAFIYLFNSGKEQALLNCCGVDHKVFCDLLDLFNHTTIADYGVHNQMQEMLNKYGAMGMVNSAFKVRLTNYLIQSFQLDPVGTAALVLNCEATSLWQLSEWGMRMIQGQFSRLKDRLLSEDFGDQKIILNVMVLLYNYQTSNVGHSQILNIFMDKKDR
eukprot:jgi/Psemu1/49421/gm1.49421_g